MRIACSAGVSAPPLPALALPVPPLLVLLGLSLLAEVLVLGPLGPGNTGKMVPSAMVCH